MNFDQIIELIKAVSNSELTSFQYEEGNQKISMQAGGIVLNGADFNGGRFMQSNTAPAMAEVVQSSVPVQQTVVQSDSMQSVSVEEVVQAMPAATGEVVVSPLVGRFYVAPSEDAEPFVKVGDTVKKGQVLAIVEAMKLMNEIESDFDGIVAEVLAENGEGVEYGQPLFRIV